MPARPRAFFYAMSGLGAPWGIERRKGTAKEWIRLTRRLLSLPSHGREVSSHLINTILDAQQQRDTEARGKPAVLSSISTRNAAYYVVRWCVFRAIATYAVARDAELRSVLQRRTEYELSSCWSPCSAEPCGHRPQHSRTCGAPGLHSEGPMAGFGSSSCWRCESGIRRKTVSGVAAGAGGGLSVGLSVP